MPTVQPVHVFPFTLFVIAVVLNYVLWWHKYDLVRKLIVGACGYMTTRYVDKCVDVANDDEIAASKPALSPAEKGDLRRLFSHVLTPTEHSMGRMVALIEETLYLYSAFAQIESIFSGVLLFKAFHTWIAVSRPVIATAATGATTPTAAVSRQYARFCADRTHTLVKFYEYAIGNFISLGIALAIYVLVIKTAYHCPHFANWTNYLDVILHPSHLSQFTCALDPAKG